MTGQEKIARGYTVRVRNTGLGTANGVSLSDLLPGIGSLGNPDVT